LELERRRLGALNGLHEQPHSDQRASKDDGVDPVTDLHKTMPSFPGMSRNIDVFCVMTVRASTSFTIIGRSRCLLRVKRKIKILIIINY